MTQYQRGFVDRRSALQAVRLPAQMCAGPLPYNTQMEVARGQSWIIKTGSSGIPGRTSYDPGRALCDSYIVDENPNPPALLEETNQNNDTLNQYVYNLSTDPVAPNEWFIAVQVGNVLVVSAGGGGGGIPNRRIQFRSTTKMTQGSITGTVILSEGPTGYAIGDLVDFKDPFNLFMDAEPDAIGWAYFRPAGEHCDLEEGRWEVEELSLPVRKISGRTLSCLKKDDTEATIELSLDSG